MAGARSLQLGFELIAHDAGERALGDVHGTLLMQPGLESPITGEACGSREPLLELHEDGGR
jgi:hypothetical protein